MTKQITVGSVRIGGGAPVSIQSMCNSNTADVAATSAQIRALADAGCDIVRVAVPDMDAARAIPALKRASSVPLVADIHFDWRLALEAVRGGIDKIRINPGNIGDEARVRTVADACRAAGVPIRVGVNGGSLDRDLRAQYGVSPESLCRSAQRNIEQLERCGFHDICISLKSSDVFTTIRAYRLLHAQCDYPVHLGVTEAGTPHMGMLKTAAAFGALLCDGIGDTLRVTLTADPVAEVQAAKDILRALDLHTSGVTVVSCPTCGRTRVDLIPIAEEVERRTAHLRARLRVAVMGCAVNGPGEARDADVGIACGLHDGLLIRHGEIVCKVPEDELVSRLLREIEEMTGEKL